MLAFGLAIGIFYFTSGTTSVPKIGETSLALAKSLERGGNIPVTIEFIMKEINKEAINEFDSHEIFDVRSYCNDIIEPIYKDSIIDKNFIDTGGVLGVPGKERNCFVDEDDLQVYFGETFNEVFPNSRSSLIFGDLDLSNTDYTAFSIGQYASGVYFNDIRTTNGFEVPITKRKDNVEKQIGKFTMKPSFRIPIGYDFDNPNKEVCIFSSDCRATCDDVIDKYDGIFIFAKTEFECDTYYDCAEAALATDDFGNKYSCTDDDGNPAFLCTGSCQPFCSGNPPKTIDEDAGTVCKDYSCRDYLDCSSTGTCGCDENACIGNDCDTLHCDRDSEFEDEFNINTQCLDTCSPLKYNDCREATTCACDSGVACEGTCTCDCDWVDVGGCGGTVGNLECEWNEVPQTLSCNPSGCNSGNKCDARDENECPSPPEPEPIPLNSCEGRCGNFDPDASCQCDSACTGFGDCCGDKQEVCG